MTGRGMVTTTEAIYGTVLGRALVTHPIMGLPQLARGLSHVLRQPEPRAMEDNASLNRSELLSELARIMSHPSKHLPFRSMEHACQWYAENMGVSTVNCYMGAESYHVPMSTIETELYSIRDRLFEVAGEIAVACQFQVAMAPTREVTYGRTK